MFYAFCHNWSIVLCETKSKLFPARIPNYQAVFRKVWILYKFGFYISLDFRPDEQYPQPGGGNHKQRTDLYLIGHGKASRLPGWSF